MRRAPRTWAGCSAIGDCARRWWTPRGRKSSRAAVLIEGQNEGQTESLRPFGNRMISILYFAAFDMGPPKTRRKAWTALELSLTGYVFRCPNVEPVECLYLGV